MRRTPSRHRRLARTERREQILDVTKELVDERGFHGISIELVARRARITRPIVYHHFGDLNGLLEALMEREGRRALDQLLPALPGASRDSDVREMLLAAWTTYVEAVDRDPVTWRLVLMPPEGAPESLRHQIADGRRLVVEMLATVISGGIVEERVSPDPELTARVLIAVADETARLRLTDPAGFPIERILAQARWLLDQVSLPSRSAAGERAGRDVA